MRFVHPWLLYSRRVVQHLLRMIWTALSGSRLIRILRSPNDSLGTREVQDKCVNGTTGFCCVRKNWCWYRQAAADGDRQTTERYFEVVRRKVWRIRKKAKHWVPAGVD